LLSLLDQRTGYVAHQTWKELHVDRDKNTRSRLNRLVKECQFTRLSDIDATTLERIFDRGLERDQFRGPKRTTCRVAECDGLRFRRGEERDGRVG
jgi:hypothetical protein